MKSQRTVEIIAGRVGAAGDIQAGDGFSVRKTAGGVYVVTFPYTFRLISVTFNTYVSATGIYGGGSIPGQRSFVVSTFVSNTGAAQDAPWGFIAAGYRT